MTKQQNADMQNLSGSLFALIPRAVLPRTASILEAKDIATNMSTCRALRWTLPSVVFALRGFDEKTTDGIVVAATRQFRFIKSIDLFKCTALTDDAIVAMATHCPRLTSVNLGACSKLTDEAVDALARYCPGLTNVHLTDCCNLTDGAVELLKARCPGLTNVSLAGCNSLEDGTVEALAAHCPGLPCVDRECPSSQPGRRRRGDTPG